MNDQYIDKINWNSLATGSGNATHIPQALIGLASPNGDLRIASYWQLDNYVVVQGDLYQSAYYTIPFLLNMIKNKFSHGRDLAYDLLFEIANGYAPPNLTCNTFDNNIMPLRDACFAEISKSLDEFRLDINSPDQLVNRKARDLVDLLDSRDS